ncbi:galactosamine-6-phosphate isomerase [Arenibacter certesii]|uniref:Glucosamine-6-phosphate deaminase n=1 Tax=Arenibacter certesii TaxID=228955 RepID=A0A918J2B1_9FLAO|nr:galactosamine-6-phosphate isomerase [Arenibacter certesii]GGW44221.1 glucosamine-6-phosphate deaminase [Arenibacter certesii]
MQIHYCSDYNEMSQMASDQVIANLREQPKKLLCPTKGASPMGLYKNLVEYHEKESKLFDELTIIKQDEWGGLSASDPNSCETYLKTNLLEPLKISQERFMSFDSSPVDAKKECNRMDNEIQEKGPIDICILGMGKNGHLGFNEPDKHLIPNCHIAELSPTSLMGSMTKTMLHKPNYGLTLGMAHILQSKTIIFLLSGEGKYEATKKLMNKEISTYLPASFLWLHPNVHCYLDKSSM